MKNKKQTLSTRQMLGIDRITECSLKTASSDAVFFSVKPSNISVMSEAALEAKVYSLTTILKGMSEVEMLCVNSRESFDGNKKYLRNLAKNEANPAVQKLLEKDMRHLDGIQARTATAREFLFVVRVRGLSEKEMFAYINRI